ncbi:MAG: cytochrome C oxidase subunit IV family protein [Hyphomicrobiaceae bacterium]
MAQRTLTYAWIALVGLSIATTALTMVNAHGNLRKLLVAGVLAIAAVKARIILTRYLNLVQSRFWTRVFDIVGAVFFVLLYGIFLVGGEG